MSKTAGRVPADPFSLDPLPRDGLHELSEEYLVLVMGGNGTFTSEQPVAQAGFWGGIGVGVAANAAYDLIKDVYEHWNDPVTVVPDNLDQYAGSEGAGGGQGH